MTVEFLGSKDPSVEIQNGENEPLCFGQVVQVTELTMDHCHSESGIWHPGVGQYSGCYLEVLATGPS